MRWLLNDGDAWLLVMLLAAGTLPIAGDVLHQRPLGAAATIGGLVAVACAVGLVRRAWTHVRAEALRKRLLRP